MSLLSNTDRNSFMIFKSASFLPFFQLLVTLLGQENGKQAELKHDCTFFSSVELLQKATKQRSTRE